MVFVLIFQNSLEMHIKSPMLQLYSVWVWFLLYVSIRYCIQNYGVNLEVNYFLRWDCRPCKSWR